MKFKKSTPMPNRVMGVDPGFDRCGVAIVGREKLIFSTCLTTSPKLPHQERLLHLGDGLKAIIKQWRPEAIATEKLFFNQNVRTGLKVAEARVVILYEAARAGLPFFEYSPQDVKIAVTGYGKASKSQVEIMALRLLSLKTTPKHDAETDAIGLGITCLASVKGVWYK